MDIKTPIVAFIVFILASLTGATHGESLIILTLVFIFSALTDIRDAILGADE